MVLAQRIHGAGHRGAAKLGFGQRPPQLALVVAAPGPQLALQIRFGFSGGYGFVLGSGIAWATSTHPQPKAPLHGPALASAVQAKLL